MLECLILRFQCFEKLADFFEKNGYFTNSPSRIYRYEVLYDFAVLNDGSNKEIYAELLTYDLYLRENLKSRPGFCKSLLEKEYKDYRHDFYKEEEKTRKYLPGLNEYNGRQLSGMTHLEAFNYPVWDLKELFEGCDEKLQYMLFDYSRRNPLTKEAFSIVIE